MRNYKPRVQFRRRTEQVRWGPRSVEAVAFELLYGWSDPKFGRFEESFRIVRESVASRANLVIARPDANGVGKIEWSDVDPSDHVTVDEVRDWFLNPRLEGLREWVEPNLVMHVAGPVTPSDQHFPDQRALKAVRAPQAWEITKGSPDVLLGIIDSGIAMDPDSGVLLHGDLKNRKGLERFTWSKTGNLSNYVNEGAPPFDDGGHGTHVAGIAAATAQNKHLVAGVNWHSPVYVCKVFDGRKADVQSIYRAIVEVVDYAASEGQRAVINFSGGGPDHSALRKATDYVCDHGFLLCAAAGNDGAKGAVWAPASHAEWNCSVIAVGATDVYGEVAGISCRGPAISLVAPGQMVLSTWPADDVMRQEGTSMASPFAAGAASLVWSRWPELRAAEVKRRLIRACKPLGNTPRADDYGYGMLDIAEAVGYAG